MFQKLYPCLLLDFFFGISFDFFETFYSEREVSGGEQEFVGLGWCSGPDEHSCYGDGDCHDSVDYEHPSVFWAIKDVAILRGDILPPACHTYHAMEMSRSTTLNEARG
jgi:hypothetical protein